MLLTGIGVILYGLFPWYTLRYPIWIMGTIGLFNIILGIITPRARKVDLQPEPSGNVKFLVDKVMFRSGKFRFDNHELAFLEDRLVMKRLISWKVIQVGFVFFALIRGLIGGLTGLSLQGFLEQRKRHQIRDANEFTTVSRADVEILYGTMSPVQLTGVSFKMIVGGSPLVFDMATWYPPMMAGRVRQIIPNQCWARPGF